MTEQDKLGEAIDILEYALSRLPDKANLWSCDFHDRDKISINEPNMRPAMHALKAYHQIKPLLDEIYKAGNDIDEQLIMMTTPEILSDIQGSEYMKEYQKMIIHKHNITNANLKKIQEIINAT